MKKNLTTSLLPEIVKNKSITLLSGNAKLDWIDTKYIGEATAQLQIDFEKYQNQAYEITGTENKNFTEVAELMTEVVGERKTFKSINPLRFYFNKRKEGLKGGFALVITILHFLPGLQSEPAISQNYRKLTHRNPTILREFIERETEKFIKSRKEL